MITTDSNLKHFSNLRVRINGFVLLKNHVLGNIFSYYIGSTFLNISICKDFIKENLYIVTRFMNKGDIVREGPE